MFAIVSGVCAIAVCKEIQHFDIMQVFGWIKQTPQGKVYTTSLAIGFYFHTLFGTSRHRYVDKGRATWRDYVFSQIWCAMSVWHFPFLCKASLRNKNTFPDNSGKYEQCTYLERNKSEPVRGLAAGQETKRMNWNKTTTARVETNETDKMYSRQLENEKNVSSSQPLVNCILYTQNTQQIFHLVHNKNWAENIVPIQRGSSGEISREVLGKRELMDWRTLYHMGQSEVNR